jgi:RNA polymerase sigma-70 factor (ECF subfamily)
MPSPGDAAAESSSQAGNSLQNSLLVRLRSQDDEAWRRLDHLYGPVVFGWCRGAGVLAEDAADLRQEVFRSVAGSIASFRRDKPGDSFRGWLWRITQNKLRDFFRRRQHHPQAAGGTSFQQQLQEVPFSTDADEGSVAPHPSAAENQDVFRRALELVRSEFADATWQAFWRVVVDGRAPTEVAAELGMSAGAVYVAKSRVLRRCRAELADLLD